MFAVVNAAEYNIRDRIFGNQRFILRLAQGTGCPLFWMREQGDGAPSLSTFANFSLATIISFSNSNNSLE
jgi:hypothetical protein